MGLFDRIRGRADETDTEAMEEEFERLLGPGERVEVAYKLVRDVLLFTNWRLLFIDKQGLTGNKVEYRSIPYPSIRQFAIETAGPIDSDAELKLWLAGQSHPIREEFGKEVDIYQLQATLALGVFGASNDEINQASASEPRSEIEFSEPS